MDEQRRRKDALLARLPPIYPILDTARLEALGLSAVGWASELAAAGVRIAQYRHKGPWTRGTFEEAQEVGRVFQSADVCYIVNDRADIAVALSADGVHLGQDDLPLPDARRLIGADLILGFSTHNAQQLASSDCALADYLAIGPVFATATKRNPDPVVGLAGVREARALTGKPLVGIGGIALENAPAVFEAGADSVSMIASLSGESLPEWLELAGRK